LPEATQKTRFPLQPLTRGNVRSKETLRSKDEFGGKVGMKLENNYGAKHGLQPTLKPNRRSKSVLTG
jgi:hypothetical protein